MSDFSAYLAEEIVDWMSQDTQMDSPPGSLYVTIFDDTDSEQDGSFTDARAEVSTTDGWTKSGTDFENANEINLGEASTTVENITDVALYDSDSGGNLIARYEIDQAPFNVSDGSQLTFQAGELSFDVVDRTE